MECSKFMWDFIRTELEDVVGAENVDAGIADLITHGSDGYWLSVQMTSRGHVPTMPDIVVRPGSIEEVSKILVIANYYRIPVIPVGGVSAAQGGITPVKGGISLDTKRMNKVLEIDEQSRTITVEAGINFQQLEWIANERGYSLMHYPSSITCSTVGGFLAHNGIGVLSTKYGKIDDQCIWVEVVIPNGTVLQSAPVPKHSSGPYLKDIFLGSEGTFGVITRAKFKLFTIPEARLFRAFLFKDLASGIAAGRDMLAEFKPAILRLYDEPETRSIIRKIIGVEKSGAFMNLAVDGIARIAQIEMDRVMEICCGKYGAEDLGSDYGEKWWQHRVTFFYPGHMFKYPQIYGTIDSVGTYQNIEKIYWAMKNAIETNFPQTRFIAHFSHWYEWGCIIYDRFSVEKAPEDPMEAMRLHNQIWRTGVRAALANGGLINDHHGVGLKLGNLMKEQYGPTMMVYEGLKKMFDPNGIMNPYKMGV